MQGSGVGGGRGRDALVCRTCGAEFLEGRATEDGWHYRCPACGDGAGIGDGLRRPAAGGGRRRD